MFEKTSSWQSNTETGCSITTDGNSTPCVDSTSVQLLSIYLYLFRSENHHIQNMIPVVQYCFLSWGQISQTMLHTVPNDVCCTLWTLMNTTPQTYARTYLHACTHIMNLYSYSISTLHKHTKIWSTITYCCSSHTHTIIVLRVSLYVLITWWRHQMETFSASLAICAGNSPVPGEFPTQRPVTRSFDVYFDLRPNKRLSKQSWGCWIETPYRPLWRHRDGYRPHRIERHNLTNAIRTTLFA